MCICVSMYVYVSLCVALFLPCELRSGSKHLYHLVIALT